MPQPQPSFAACSLDARAFQERVVAIAAFNARALKGQRRDGPRLIQTYGPGSRAEVDDLVIKERDCCNFLEFRVQEQNQAVMLTITVPPDHADRADELLAPFAGSAIRPATANATCCGDC